MMTGTGVPSSQLERMAGELKCPICLSLFKQAASLSCNHCFCSSCVMQSMKMHACCPVCKVPTTPREVRSAPQMDSLVAIFKGMETSAGVSLFQTQPSQLKSSGKALALAKGEQVQRAHQELNVPKPLNKPRGRKKKGLQLSDNATHVENMNMNPPKKRRRGKSELVLSDNTNQQAGHAVGGGVAKNTSQALAPDQSIRVVGPVKKRAQVSKRANARNHKKDKAQQTKINWVSSDPHASSTSMKNAEPAAANAVELNPRISRNEGSGNISRSEVPSLQMKEGEGLASSPSDPHNLQHRISPTHFPYLDSFSVQPAQLSPFFWLRDEVRPSQDERPTQLTQTQMTARPVQPSFSDLKGSDNELSDGDQHPDEAAGNGFPEADSYDSDAFVWTQRPCSPELSTSPIRQSHDPLRSQQKSCNDQEVLGRAEKTRQGADDDESRSPLKRIVEDAVAVEATQTPQLHQEPARMMKGTLLKCSSLKKHDRGKSSSKARRRLRSNDPSPFESKGRQKSASKSVKPKRAKKKTKRGRKAAAAVANQETHEAANLTNKPDELLTDRSTKKSLENPSLQEGSNKQADILEAREKGVQGGEKRTADGDLRNEVVNNGPGCVFCGSAGDSEVAGPMVEYTDAFPSQGLTRVKTVHVHKFCADWAPDVYFNEEEPKNLACEVTRGQRIKCSSCGMRGAALGCCNKRCKKSFHYPCGRATPGCKWDEDDFVMFCPQHAECKFPRRKRCRISPSQEHSATTTQKDKQEISINNSTLVASTGGQLQRWQTGPACKWVLCGSGLDSQMKGQLVAFTQLTGASMVKRWSPSVTHVITGVDEKGAAKRTLKFLLALLEGKWIVKVEWMRECMTAGHIISEDEYEVNSDVNGFSGGPKRSRALSAARVAFLSSAAHGVLKGGMMQCRQGPKLLEGLSFYLCGEFTSMGKEDLQSLIVAGRGVVLHRKPLPVERSLSSGRVRTKVPQTGQTIVLYNGEDDGKAAIVAEEAKSVAIHAGGFAVPHTWLLDSVAACMLQPTS